MLFAALHIVQKAFNSYNNRKVIIAPDVDFFNTAATDIHINERDSFQICKFASPKKQPLLNQKEAGILFTKSAFIKHTLSFFKA